MNELTATRTKPPGIGVGVVCWHDGYILLGERTGSHGAGELALPGGRVEPNETPKECAHRELFEETGCEGNNFEKIPWWSWDSYPEADRDYLTLYFLVRWDHHNPSVKEPEKCNFWDWYLGREIPNITTGIFAGLKDLTELYPRLSQGEIR